jgi:hypothetical protein
MIKLIRNNQKKVMAVVGVFLMISFAATTGSMNRSGPGDGTIGTYDHGRSTLTAKEYKGYSGQWRFLKERLGVVPLLTIIGGGNSLSDEQIIDTLSDARELRFVMQMRDQVLNMQGELGNLARAEAIGERIYGQLENNDDMFVLLVKDAQMQGVGVNGDLIDSILAKKGITKDSDIALYDSMQQTLRSLFMVTNAADQAASIVKVSRPEVSNLLASRLQQIAVNVLEYNAKDFLDKVPAPTAAQIHEHFDKYKDKLVAEGPLAFGYKYPDRVQYDAVIIKKEDVKKGLPPIDLVDAAQYYLEHKARYTSTTAPSTRPQDTFNIDAGPTTRQMTFEESKDKIIQTLTDQKTDELMDKIRDAVRDTMKADYEAYKSAIDAKLGTPISSLGVTYTDSKGYIAALRDKIQADFKVTLTTDRAERWESASSIAELKLGKDAFSTAETGVSFAQYITSRVNPFFSDDDKKKLAQARGDNKLIAVWEPAPIFRDARDDLMIARPTAADPSHVPASLDEVKDKVTADVKMAAANELAKKAAQAALDAAKSGKWLQTVAAADGKNIRTTDLFGPTDGSRSAKPMTGLDLKGVAQDTFVQASFKLLAAPSRSGTAPRPASTQATTQATTQAAMPTSAPVISSAFKDHPIGLIELPSDAKIMVAEINQIKPIWSKDHQAEYNSAAASQERSSTEQLIRMNWYDYDQLIKRLDYVPAEKHERKPSQQLPPLNPFGS